MSADKPLFHHLLVIEDWEIAVNELFLEESGPKEALTDLVADESDPLRLGAERARILDEADDFDDLRSALEDHDLSIYIHTIEAPEGVGVPTPLPLITEGVSA